MSVVCKMELIEYVTRLCAEERYDEVEGVWFFQSGGYCCTCTDGAMKIALAFRGRVMGYSSVRNPTAAIGLPKCEGHDFALIANRFAVDYWAYRVACMVSRPVLDFADRTDSNLISKLYGDRKSWESVSSKSLHLRIHEQGQRLDTRAAHHCI